MAKITSRTRSGFRGAYKQLFTTLKMMEERGILIVCLHRLGRAHFNFAREIELYQALGLSACRAAKNWQLFDIGEIILVNAALKQQNLWISFLSARQSCGRFQAHQNH